MPLKFKLSHQGLLLVAIPLAFELIFVGILYYTLNQAEMEIKREARAKEIVQQVNNANKRMMDSVSFVAGYCMTGKKIFGDKYKETIAKIPNDFAVMRSLIAGNKEEMQEVEKFASMMDTCIKALDKAEKLQEEGHRVKAYQQMVASKELFQDLLIQANNVSATLEQLEKTSPGAQEKSRQTIKGLLAVGVVLNIFIALFLALYFNKWTTQRLKILMDNTGRLAKGLPLNPLIKGSDEIAQLDKVFNEMAIALEEAARKERETTANAVAAEARIRNIIDTMPVGLVIISEKGIIELINPATEQMFGYQFSEVKDLNMQILFKEKKTTEEKFLPELLNKALGHIIVSTALKRNQSEFPINLSITEFNRQDSKSFLVVIIDITERYEIERLKQEFVAMVSHELRSPLTSVQGFLELLKEGIYGNLNERGQQTVSMADRNINRLMKLIRDLLDVERVESGVMSIQATNTDISSVVDKAIETTKKQAEDNNISIEYSGSEISLFADGDRLAQVIINFISNAIKFSPTGSKIIIESQKIDDQIEVKVKDQGRGIPTKYHQSIFERFQQVDSSDSKQKGGSGLGLAICKAIIEQHGGKIGVISEEGKGSCFWFRIPYTFSLIQNS